MPTTASYCDIFERHFGIPKSTAMMFVQRLREDERIFRRAGVRRDRAYNFGNFELDGRFVRSDRYYPQKSRYTFHGQIRTQRTDYMTDLDQWVPPEAVGDLSLVRAMSFGEALDSLVDDMRTGTYARWKRDRIASTRIRFFNNGGRIIINLERYTLQTREWSKAFVYRSENPADRSPSLTYIHELDGMALEALAAVLGPPEPPTQATSLRTRMSETKVATLDPYYLRERAFVFPMPAGSKSPIGLVGSWKLDCKESRSNRQVADRPPWLQLGCSLSLWMDHRRH